MYNDIYNFLYYQNDHVANSTRQMGVLTNRHLRKYDSKVYLRVFVPQLHRTSYLFSQLSQAE